MSSSAGKIYLSYDLASYCRSCYFIIHCSNRYLPNWGGYKGEIIHQTSFLFSNRAYMDLNQVSGWIKFQKFCIKTMPIMSFIYVSWLLFVHNPPCFTSILDFPPTSSLVYRSKEYWLFKSLVVIYSSKSGCHLHFEQAIKFEICGNPFV